MTGLDKNKETALEVSRAIMRGDWDRVEALLSDDFQYIGDGAPALNKVQYIGFMREKLCTAMSNMDMTFIRVIAEGDLVAVDYTNKMTHTGEFFGIPATHKRVLASGQFIREIKGGEVTAEWQTTNSIGLLKQIGAIPKK